MTISQTNVSFSERHNHQVDDSEESTLYRQYWRVWILGNNHGFSTFYVYDRVKFRRYQSTSLRPTFASDMFIKSYLIISIDFAQVMEYNRSDLTDLLHRKVQIRSIDSIST